MTDRYERIRAALAMGPTPGPFSTVRSYSPGNQELILSLTYKDEHGITENYCIVRNRLGDTWKTEANAAYIAACDPDTIRALLDERDALAAEVERVRGELREQRQHDEALLRQALEALEGLFGVPDQWTGAGAGGVAVWRPGGADSVRAAIAALRERLEGKTCTD